MGLQGSIRASFNTISIIEHRSLNAIARGRIPNKMIPAWPPAAIPMQSHLLWRLLDGGTSVRGLFAPMRIGP